MWEALDVRRLRAEILADRGELRQSLACLEGVADGFLTHGYAAQASEVLVVSGHYLVALGDESHAQAAWRRAIEVATDDDDQWIRREAVSVWSDWLIGQGRDDEATQIRERYSCLPDANQ